jgi:hypothetical protein
MFASGSNNLGCIRRETGRTSFPGCSGNWPLDGYNGDMRFRSFPIALALFAFPALAFDTPIHGEITRGALANSGIDETGLSLIVAGNLNTDYDPVLYNLLYAHFCNEQFDQGSNRLREKMVEALHALSKCDRGAALDAFGTSLHAIQDFYAHSNGINVYPAASATVDLFHLHDPGPGVVCSPGHLPRELTSAYWPDDGNFPGKCTHDQIAKDLPEVGPEFYVARDRAVLATAVYYQAVEQMVQWALPDAELKLSFLKTGGSCAPSGKLKHADKTWLPKLQRVMNAIPGVVSPRSAQL